MSDTATRSGEASAPARVDPAALALFVAALVVAWHASAGPQLYDAGELTAAAARLGASHPPGQPLHALLGQLSILLVPLGPIPLRLSLLSVAMAALGAWLAGRISAEAALRGGASPSAARLAHVAVGLAVFMSPPVLRQAGRPEVYALALALSMLGARALLRWAHGEARSAGALCAGALCAGLLLAVHPPHALALLVGGALLLVLVKREQLRAPAALGAAALACILGSCVLAYLPIRSLAGAPSWGDATSASGFFAYVSGAAYRTNLGLAEDRSTLAMLGYALYAVGPLALLACTAAAMQRKTWLAPLAWLALGALPAALLQPLEERNPDNVAYAAPFVALALALGGAALARAMAHPDSLRRGVAGAALTLTALGLPGSLDAPATLRGADLPYLETLAGALLDAPRARALVITESDYAGATWMMAREVDGARPDVAFFAEGLATSSWHWRTLAPHPAFDGEPRRDGDGDGYAPWIAGAVRLAAPQIPIYAETEEPLRGNGTLVGPYAALIAGEGARDARSVAERGAALPAHALSWAPGGDHDAAAGVVRGFELVRATRLLARGMGSRAVATLHLASAGASDAERSALCADAPACPLRSQRAVRTLPPTVRDPALAYPGAADVIRAGAATLFAVGEEERALAVLAAQADAGDARALLQLAWIYVSVGDVERGRLAAGAFATAEPDASAELADIRAALAQP